MRIRFIDLDTPCPLLNPYFLLKGMEVSGIWSEEILAWLERARPGVEFEELCEGLGGLGVGKEVPGGLDERGRGRGAGGGRGMRVGRSVRVQSYRGLAEVGTLVQ